MIIHVCLTILMISIINELNKTIFVLTLDIEKSRNFGENNIKSNNGSDVRSDTPFKSQLFKTRYILLITNSNSCGCRTLNPRPVTQGIDTFDLFFLK